MRYWAFALLAFAASVNAQTRTITAGGATVVVDITSVPDDNGNTVKTTSTIRTVGGNAPNPIADQPQSADPDAPTYYWVTETDADGNTIVNSYIFTPTFRPTSAPVAYSPGTILEYSDFTASYATRTSYPNGMAPLLSKNSVISLTLMLGAAVGGMLLVLA